MTYVNNITYLDDGSACISLLTVIVFIGPGPRAGILSMAGNSVANWAENGNGFDGDGIQEVGSAAIIQGF